MNEKEYLLSRINALQQNVNNKKLPLALRRNQAHALIFYLDEIKKLSF